MNNDSIAEIIGDVFSSKKKRKPVIQSLVRVTPGKTHAWVQTDVGVIRKNVDSIPDEVMTA